MQRSRRLLFVLSPNFLAEKSFSLLECRLGLYLENSLRASIVAVVYRSVSKLPCVEVPQLRQATITTVTWRGSRSEPQRSRFWLRLRLALPVRPLALGRRLIDSTSSHSDLAAMALQRAQRIQNQSRHDRANQGRRNRLTDLSRRGRQARPRGSVKRGVMNGQEGAQHSRSFSGCPGFMGHIGDTGVELTVEVQTQQESCDRPEVRSDPETDPSPIPDPTHDGRCSPNPAPIPELPPDRDTSQDNKGKHNGQQLSSLRTSEEILPS